MRKLAAAYAKHLFQILRHGAKSAFGMLARSAYKPAGGHLFQILRHGAKSALGMSARSA
jgi:hypothetical protein